MLSLNKKESSSDASKSPDKAPFSPSVKLVLLVIAVTLSAGWVFWSYQNLIVAKQQQQLLLLSQQQAKKAQELVHFRIRRINAVLRKFGRRQALLDALKQDESELSSWLGNLKRSLPEGSQSAIIRASSAPESQYPELQLRFAELDSINQAKRNEATLPEIGGAKKARTITFVSAVVTEQEVSDDIVAILLARVPITYLIDSFARNNNFDGKVRLQQTFVKTKPQTVLSVGQGSGQEVALKINDLWQLYFQPGSRLIQSTQSFPLAVYISWPLVLLASILVALFASHKHKQSQATIAAKANAMNQNSIMAVQLAEEDQDLLAGDASGRSNLQASTAPAVTTSTRFVPKVFRAYDIRGLAEQEINQEFANVLGKALGTRLHKSNSSSIFVGRDGRNQSPQLYQALIEGLTSTGIQVLELGLVPSPLLYYAVATSEECKNGIIVTASHNSAQYNGFKITLNGSSLPEEEIQQLRTAMESDSFTSGNGNAQPAPVNEQYIDEILSDVALMGEIKLVIDAGNGATSDIAPLLFSEMGCDVIPLYCEVDGDFPNHDPDPSKAENLQDLIARVQQEEADLGVAFDGDGDRIFVVTNAGEIITPDRLLMLFARDIVARNPGTDVVYDVKCTRQLGSLISSYGGRPIMWKTGHANMKNKIQETGALLGGEYSGHIFIKDRWYGFDDGLLAAARLLEIMSLREQSLDEIFEAFPVLPATPEIRIASSDEDKFRIVEKLIEKGDFQTGTASTIDGLRVDFAKGWGLVRASNTGPELTLRFEGETEDVIDQLKMLFKRELDKVAPQLSLDF